MNAAHAYADLQRLGKPVITTAEAAARWRATRSATSRMMGRLASAGLVRPLRRGFWSLLRDNDPLILPEYLTAPFPAYISFQSALHLHGMISQIPSVIYVASLAPTRTIETTVGTYSVHRLSPEFFGGYEVRESGIQLARPEKALLDVLYLANTRSRLFTRLPELDLPSRFNIRDARRWIARISSPYRRTMVTRRLNAILAGHQGRSHRQVSAPTRHRR